MLRRTRLAAAAEARAEARAGQGVRHGERWRRQCRSSDGGAGAALLPAPTARPQP